MRLTTPIEEVPGVGVERGAAFRRLGMPSVAHLLYHLPARYEHEEAETTIDRLIAGRVVSARGEVTDTRVVHFGKVPRFTATIADATGSAELVWFRQTYLKGRIHPGVHLRVQGKAKSVRGRVQIANPVWREIEPGDETGGATEARLRPVYPASEELPSKAIEDAVGAILDEAAGLIEDHLTEPYRSERGLVSLADAYRLVHRPGDDAAAERGHRRLVYDELLLLQLAMRMRREQVRRTRRAPALKWSEAIDARIRARFPFAFTAGQDAVIAEVREDLQRDTPTSRLIQGDVGAGKTVVALYAMLMAVASKHQAALMAPTELLAEQHYASITSVMEGSQVRMALLTGSLDEEERGRVVRGIASGEIDMVIGTHALLTESVRFSSLGVAVIDEQHRFGVQQRLALKEKADDEASMPHTVVMTATPIPRTLALTVFGDLDVSTLAGLPPGRKPVKTRVVGPDDALDVYRELRARVDRGEQAYVVVPAVEAGELKDVRSTVERLERDVLAGVRIAGVHGRLKRSTRETIMERFRSGTIKVLVATTVIEVGVDVPNATMMVIEHAERFGLAQLHQLRGRVGRGSVKSECVLIGEAATAEAKARLRAIATTSDGFKLAEKDLELRGMGEMVGARQAGVAPFRLVEFPRDLAVLEETRRDAAAWIAASPELRRKDELLLRSRLMKAHGEALGVAGVA
ncbi:MAG: ATP-dependent DNA helicase RecG [Phycisphaeraceae bacterium]|nr:ATP-dependent DNA helicase RecG [Phycisphaerales bacterium]MCB9842996.1 ATP-dependent DNA helicase RecG [Phycisphaeraceae bacterium]